jgi:hypothetical protein
VVERWNREQDLDRARSHDELISISGGVAAARLIRSPAWRAYAALDLTGDPVMRSFDVCAWFTAGPLATAVTGSLAQAASSIGIGIG